MKNLSIHFLSIMLIATLSMCNNSKNESNAANEHVHLNKKMQHGTDACATISAEDNLKYTSKEISVKGDVEHPLTLTVDSLKKMNVANIQNFEVVCQSGASMKKDSTCKGVLLKDILEKATLKQSNHKDRNFYIVARATDNYKATFSWGEIFNNPTGDNVYVIFEENGQAIKEQGDMILICKNDIKAGPRHVYWLNSIEVQKIN